LRGLLAGGVCDSIAVEDEDGEARPGSKRNDRALRDTTGSWYQPCLHVRVIDEEGAQAGERDQRDDAGGERCGPPGEGSTKRLDMLHGPSRFALRTAAPPAAQRRIVPGQCS
jgi:hypothetical protein